jgi:hypothetical protein
MRLEHRFDPRRAHAAVESRDDALVPDERERRNAVHLELLRKVGLPVDVDAGGAQPTALLAGEVCEQALHSARGA